MGHKLRYMTKIASLRNERSNQRRLKTELTVISTISGEMS